MKFVFIYCLKNFHLLNIFRISCNFLKIGFRQCYAK